MTTEASVSEINNLEKNKQNSKQAVRPKFLRLSNVQMPITNRSGKKNKFKFKQQSQPIVQEKYTDDPAYTEDVRHLALPMRRNSGPESSSAASRSARAIAFMTQPRLADISSSSTRSGDSRLDQKVKKRKSHKSDEKIRGSRSNNKRIDSSSSDDDTNHMQQQSVYYRGQSLDRNISKQQKKTLCFQRDRASKSPDSRSSKYKSYHRSDTSVDNLLHEQSSNGDYYDDSRDYGTVSGQRHSSRASRSRERYTQHSVESSSGSAYLTPPEMPQPMEFYEYEEQPSKSKDSNRFRIGKQFLKGEIGIKSFNYYLLKEGIKSSKKKILKQRTTPDENTLSVSRPPLTRSKENIYEEIRFDDDPPQSPSPPQLYQQHHKHQPQQQQRPQPPTSLSNYPDCELCIQECTKNSCDICKNIVPLDDQQESSKSVQSPLTAHPSDNSQYMSHKNFIAAQNESLANLKQFRANVLQYQSYNPSNPGVYKIETTPVAFTSDYNPIHQLPNTVPPPTQQQHHQQALYEAHRTKSSSSSDSLHQKYAKQQQHQQKHHQPPQQQQQQPQQQQPPPAPDTYATAQCDYLCAQQPIEFLHPKIYKTDSRSSILSGNNSVKSENSHKYQKAGMEMSDSSIGDSLFSYPSQRRFGSSESCRFEFECRRCSFDDEKCGFSDTCRYDCRNCDCSSSYFSSDFDDASFSRNNSQRGGPQQHSTNTNNMPPGLRYIDDTIDMQKTSRYAEDFIKHIANVKKNSVYQTVSNPTYSYSGMSAISGYSRPADAIDEMHLDSTRSSKINNQKSDYGGRIESNIDPRYKPQHHHYESISKYLKSSDKSSSSKSGSSKSSPAISDSGGGGGSSGRATSRTGAIPRTNPSKIDQSTKDIGHDYADIELYTRVTKKIIPEKEPLRKNNSLPRSVKEQKLVQKCENIIMDTDQPRVVGEILKCSVDNQAGCDEQGKGKRPSKKKLSDKSSSSPAADSRQPKKSWTNADDDDEVFDLAVAYEPPKYNSRERCAALTKSNTTLPIIPTTTTTSELSSSIQHSPCAESSSQHIYTTQYDKNSLATINADKNVAFSSSMQSPRHNIKVSNASGTGVCGVVDGGSCESDGTCGVVSTIPSSISNLDSSTTNATTNTVYKRRSSSTTISTIITNTTTLNTTTTTTTTTIKTAATIVDNEQKQNHAEDDSQPIQQQHFPKPTNGNGGNSNSNSNASVNVALQLLPSSASIAPADGMVKNITKEEKVSQQQAEKATNVVNAKNISIVSESAGITLNRESLNQPEPIYTKVHKTNNTTVAAAAAATAVTSTITNSNTINSLTAKVLAETKNELNASLISDAIANHTKNKFQHTQNPVKHHHSLPTSSRAKSRQNAKLRNRAAHRTSTENIPDMKLTESSDIADYKRKTSEMSRYLFGDYKQHLLSAGSNNNNNKSTNTIDNEIYLNKSGWVQVNQIGNSPRRNSSKRLEVTDNSKLLTSPSRVSRIYHQDKNHYGPKSNYESAFAVRSTNLKHFGDEEKRQLKASASKLEELINRNAARRIINPSQQHKLNDKLTLVTDPHVSALLTERPGFLPVKQCRSNDSPPLMTPIISPPPAFQDFNVSTTTETTLVTNRNHKGMVFSKSFEYNTRQSQKENAHNTTGTYSKSFDFDFTSTPQNPVVQRRFSKEKDKMFATLTGVSPSYLTKINQNENSANRASAKINERKPMYIRGNSSGVDYGQNAGGKKLVVNDSRLVKGVERQYGTTKRADIFKSREKQPGGQTTTKTFRSLDASVNSRLNSCDSGARSDLSNDEADDDNAAYTRSRTKPQSKFVKAQSQILIKKQRSLTPEKIIEDHYSYIKKRSITPEKRRQKNSSDESYKSSTLERQQQQQQQQIEQQQHLDDRSSRDSSSSSYSGGDDRQYRKSQYNQMGKSVNETNRIRRSRSLQLTEKLQNRNQPSHRIIVKLGNDQQSSSASRSSNSYTHKSRIDHRPTPVAPEYRTQPNLHVYAGDQQELDFDYNDKYQFDKSRSFDDDYRYQKAHAAAFNNEYRSISNDRMNSSSIAAAVAAASSAGKLLHTKNSPQSYGSRLYDHEMMYDFDRELINRSPIIEFRRQQNARIAVRESSIKQQQQKLPSSMKSGNDSMLIPVNQSFMHNINTNTTTTTTPTNINNNNNINQTNVVAASVVKSPLFRRDLSPSMASPRESNKLFARNSNLMNSDMKYECYNSDLVRNNDRDYKNQTYTCGYSSPSPTKIVNIPSPGSCTGNFCDFWPNCGVTCYKRNYVTAENNEQGERYQRQSNNHSSLSSPVMCCGGNETFTDYCTKISESVPNLCKIQSTKDEIQNDSKLSPIYKMNKNDKTKSIDNDTQRTNEKIYKSHSITFLAEREMPITRDRVTTNKLISNRQIMTNDRKLDSAVTSSGGGNSSTEKIIPKSNSGNIKNSISPTYRRKIRSQLLQSSGQIIYPIQGTFSGTHRSRSLPHIHLGNRYSSINDFRLHGMLSPKLTNQMRAVSSPSLISENPTEIIKNKPTITNAAYSNDMTNRPNNQRPEKLPMNGTNTVSNNNVIIIDKQQQQQQQQQASGSVLQKLKNTFSHLKGKSSAVTITSTDCGDATSYRLGPLVWRSSKERKNKQYRNDKCNSGDSGIQCELDAGTITTASTVTSVIQHQTRSSLSGRNSRETSPLLNLPVRRANSAKEQSSSTSPTTSSPMTKNRLKYQQQKTANITAHQMPLSKRSYSQPSSLDRIPPPLPPPDDCCESDSDSLTNDYQPVFAEVLYSFKPAGSQELALEKGELVEVIKRDSGPWWWGHIKHDAILSSSSVTQLHEGWFPKDFVRILSSSTFSTKPPPDRLHSPAAAPPPLPSASSYQQEVESIYQQVDTINCPITTKCITPTSSNDQASSTQKIRKLFKQRPVSCDFPCIDTIRNNIIKELLDTEINYVKLLTSLCEGFLPELQQRPDIFSAESLTLIFSNIEKIWNFQQTFLFALHTGIEENKIAETFLEFQSAFMIYSTYCNSYPRALMELEIYTGNTDATTIFENCRISQNLPELPLSAHLLVPIQRICRYPLHLSELVKHSATRQELYETTDPYIINKLDAKTIDCKEMFELALAAMKHVTETVNEGKRHSEYLGRIQSSFENFQGPPLNVHSTRLFLQTDAIRMTPNLWNNTYTLFLFDHQLIYCKKDILKRATYIYKGRIFLDNCRVLNLADGKLFGVTLKNTLRLYSDTRNKWFDFSFRSATSKIRFLNTLAVERKFCGQNLFISELDGIDADDTWSDRDYNSDCNEYSGNEQQQQQQQQQRYADAENLPPIDNVMMVVTPSSSKSKHHRYLKKSETLPKKTRKSSLPKDNTQINVSQQQQTQTNSLGRKRFGYWVRRAKSTNSTPSQSPTHQHPIVTAAATSAALSPQKFTSFINEQLPQTTDATQIVKSSSIDINNEKSLQNTDGIVVSSISASTSSSSS